MNNKNKSKTSKTSGFASNVLKLVTGKVLSQTILLLTMPILSRLYSPADFGIYQLFISVTAIVIVIASLRYEMAILLPKKEKEAATLVALSIIIVFIISFISFIVFIFVILYSIYNKLFNDHIISYLEFLLVIILAGLGLKGVEKISGIIKRK